MVRHFIPCFKTLPVWIPFRIQCDPFPIQHLATKGTVIPAILIDFPDGTTGDVCPVGHYCPVGSTAPVPCPPATYMNSTGASACDSCPEGFFCVSGATAEPCPQGFYCPPGTAGVFEPCPEGTFGATDRLTNETECTQCTGGFYCNQQNLTAPAGPCDAGYYCVSGML